MSNSPQKLTLPLEGVCSPVIKVPQFLILHYLNSFSASDEILETLCIGLLSQNQSQRKELKLNLIGQFTIAKTVIKKSTPNHRLKN
jgi:hypothetical protein